MNVNPIAQIDLVTIGATIAIFTVTYFIMRKVFFLPVIEVMERRQEQTRAADEKYGEAEEILAHAETERTRIREAANEDANLLTSKSRAKTEQLREARLAEARTDAERLLEEGRAAIHDDAELERARLRSEAVECVSLSCEKIFGKVDQGVVESAVDRVIAKTLH